MVLGRNKSGTLRLSEDNIGLHYQVDLPDTTYARDLAISMERGDVSQSSFRLPGDPWWRWLVLYGAGLPAAHTGESSAHGR
jgi:HK97 family phage prohead protease